MTAPTDVRDLLESFRQLGIQPGLVAKAEEILSVKASDIGEWIELAVALRERGEFHAALETYDCAMLRFPDSYMLWGNRGFLLLYWERYHEALENFAVALRIKPDYTAALANMASTYERLHEFEKAVQTFLRVVELAPEHAVAWNSLGLCLGQLGDDEGAKRSYVKALEVDPKYQDPLFNLATLLCSQHKYAEALPYAKQLLAFSPDDAEAVQLLDEILREPAEPRDIRIRNVYRERKIFRFARREGTKWLLPTPENIELLTYTVRTPSNIAYDDPVPTSGNWDKQEVWENVRRLLAAAGPPRPFDEPLIFVSYRWESEEHNRWVARFVNDLKSRGYGIVYDGDLRRFATPPSVPELVARIATCNYFMPILTELYRRRVELVSNDGGAVKEDGWVFDEWQLALKLYVIERLKIVGVWRSGPVVPVPLTKDRVLDFRDSDAYLQLLEAGFPRLGSARPEHPKN